MGARGKNCRGSPGWIVGVFPGGERGCLSMKKVDESMIQSFSSMSRVSKLVFGLPNLTIFLIKSNDIFFLEN